MSLVNVDQHRALDVNIPQVWSYLQLCRAQAELDGLQEEQARQEIGQTSTMQAPDLELRKDKVFKLVKVSSYATAGCLNEHLVEFCTLSTRDCCESAVLLCSW